MQGRVDADMSNALGIDTELLPLATNIIGAYCNRWVLRLADMRERSSSPVVGVRHNPTAKVTY